MYTSTRKLDRLRAGSGSNCGWSTDCLVTGPDKHAEKQNRLRASSRINLGWLAEGLGTGQTKLTNADRLKAFSGSNCGWSTDSPVTGPDEHAGNVIPARASKLNRAHTNPVKLDRILTGERSLPVGRRNKIRSRK